MGEGEDANGPVEEPVGKEVESKEKNSISLNKTCLEM